MADTKTPETFASHWKAIVACSIVAMCQFQYGLDSTLIGGIQAMPGFLKVNPLYSLQFIPSQND
jgi:SP family sugar:H+ symporter-like MFS transporter